MASLSTVNSFDRSSMSQEGQKEADSANKHSSGKVDVLFPSVSRTVDNTVYAASESRCWQNNGQDGKNLSSVSTSVSDLHLEGNGKANQDAETKKDSQEQPDGALRSSNEDDQPKKSVDLPDLQDTQVQSFPTENSEESDVMEQDVKVCDICGDAGREDLLAICCRCSDGAEHTYCMREMLRKVPEGNWLCEECKFIEDCGNPKPGLLVEVRTSNKGSLSTQILGKRPGENIGVASSAKKQVLDENIESPRNPSGAPASSRDSVKNVDKGKRRMALKVPPRNRSFHESSESPRSPNTSRLQISKSTLLKSNSFSAFSMNQKVKQVEEGFPQKQRGLPSFDTRTGPLKTLGKSTSFKSVNRGFPKALDSKVKMISSKPSHIQEVKGSKPRNEQNTIDKNKLPKLDVDRPSLTRSNTTLCTSKLDQKLLPRGEAFSLSSVTDNRDSSVVPSDGRSSPSFKPTSYIARKGTDIAVGSGSSSSDGVCNAFVRKKSNLISPRNGTFSGSSLSCNNAAGSIQDGLSRSREPRNHVEKAQETSVSRPGQTASIGVKARKCEEVGQSTESCLRSNAPGCEVDVPLVRSSRVEINYGSKATAAVTSAMLKKPGIYRRNKALDKSENSSVPTGGSAQERSSFTDALRKPADGICEGPAPQSCSSYTNIHMACENGTQLNGFLNGVACSHKEENSDSAVLSQGKSVLRELPFLASAILSSMKKATIIPDNQCIWQGGFEVHREDKPLDLLGGVQAHLPTSVSPRIKEMVSKLSDKISLTEVPRISTWPVQFHESGTNEANIALYFFAKDLESYERSYRGFLENMIKSDLALKGDLGGIELLVFPSNQLPEKSQRWNMSFYLWGVFKGRKENGVDHGCDDGENSKTEQKIDIGRMTECDASRELSLSKDGVASQIHDRPALSANIDQQTGQDPDDKVIQEDTLSAERCLFPVGSQESHESTSSESSMQWNPDCNGAARFHGGSIPDLELALGAEAKSPNKGFPSFWVGIMDKKDDQGKTSLKEKDEEGSTSLSLSLSFPFPPDEERTVKPFPKEKLLQEGTL